MKHATDNPHSANPYSLQPAKLSWSDSGIPSADDYGDVYFSRDNGVEESRYVFLEHNQLADRWTRLDPMQQGHFTILETGFGSGLNFLLCWQLWRELAPPSWQLQYLSIEKHPMLPADLRRAQSHWPQFDKLAAILQQNYPALIPGQHRRVLASSPDQAGVTLDLLFGDIHQLLPQLADGDWALRVNSRDYQQQSHNHPKVDAWLLDGFAPAQNPAMWQEPLYTMMAALSGPGSSFATFTAAGIVKRGLRRAGFKVDKVKGYGRKRDMLCGHWQGTPDTDASNDQQDTATAVTHNTVATPALPWHTPASTGTIEHIAVIGAGLAGCSTAHALARRGYKVTVIERHPQPASEASGNPQGILYTKLSPDPGPLNQFTLASFLYAVNHYREILDNNPDIHGALCGVLQLAGSNRDQSNFAQLGEMLADQDWLQYFPPGGKARLAELGVPPSITAAAHFYPGAGWLSPPDLCRHWLDHSNITTLLNTEVLQLDNIQRDDRQAGWAVSDKKGDELCRADAVVIATANDAKNFWPSAYLPIRPIRGQISVIPADSLAAPLHTVICHEGYIAPAHNARYTIGASFDLNNSHSEISDDDHQWNLQQLRSLLPELEGQDIPVLGGRAALRCASPDYMPVVGALPVAEDFDRVYAKLRRDARSRIEHSARYQPNLYINIAHGSRGLTSTPLCAELIASYISAELRPLDRELCEQLSPARFIIRDLCRNRR